MASIHFELLQMQNTQVGEVALFLMLPFVIVFSFIIFIFYRQGREIVLHKKQLTLELKALRAQMNPHFMFNCLTSIQHSIKAGRNEEAGEYLMKFAYLTRRILENSNKRWIALSEEVELLRAYLDLERMHTDHSFNYSIAIHPDLDVENTSVLMLLVQPILENTIKYAFGQGQAGASIDIAIKSFEGKLLYTITDNGLAQQKPASMDTIPEEVAGKQQSMGLALVREQLQAIKVLEKADANFTIIPRLDDDGKPIATLTQLYIPLRPLH